MKRIIVSITAMLIAVGAFADEGMWLLPLLQKMNSKALKEAGCKLSPKEIYDINGSSLKDAIVQFGGGCTGEVISGQGLVVTNHHCGYSAIQGLSTDEHNYLMNGFWAKTFAEEIPAPGLSVTFLVSMEEVKEGQEKQAEEAAKAANPGCDVEVESFYDDNVKYLIVYKTYRDVRLVGTPPASMGKFGGETDNWVWPRHTCDFSMFRIYADAEGNPAAYSPSNVPLQPKRFLKISLAGVKENDYTMILGYPGSTQRYQTAAQLEQMIRTNRIRIDARTVRQDIMWDAMVADPSVNLKYASKYASSANGWKKWQGEELAFESLDIIGREKQKEADLTAWIEAGGLQEKYGSAIADIEKYVEKNKESNLALTLLTEAPYRIELVGFAGSLMGRYGRALQNGADSVKAMEDAKKALGRGYRDYVPELDKKEAVALLNFYRDRAKPEDFPVIPGEDFATMDIPAYVEKLFGSSVFVSEEKLAAADSKAIFSDPAYEAYSGIMAVLMKYAAAMYGGVDTSYSKARKAFTAALMEWKDGEPMYPDANFTMRLTYGTVLPYSPKDAILYKYYSTEKGILEKAREYAGNPEFIVPDKLRTALEAKDFGRWADADGSLHTCFLTNNDITGGNSGSPVLNAKGELIGLAFDGNWESMSSDVMFEPDLQRCICVDIRYVLFTVEKIGGATNIIDELTYAGNGRKK